MGAQVGAPATIISWAIVAEAGELPYSLTGQPAPNLSGPAGDPDHPLPAGCMIRFRPAASPSA